jgi:hypothetical protein
MKRESSNSLIVRQMERIGVLEVDRAKLVEALHDCVQDQVTRSQKEAAAALLRSLVEE